MEKLKFYIVANGIISDADQKKAVSLAEIGAATYKLLKNLIAPAKIGDKTYDQLVAALTAHYSQ